MQLIQNLMWIMFKITVYLTDHRKSACIFMLFLHLPYRKRKLSAKYCERSIKLKWIMCSFFCPKCLIPVLHLWFINRSQIFKNMSIEIAFDNTLKILVCCVKMREGCVKIGFITLPYVVDSRFQIRIHSELLYLS